MTFLQSWRRFTFFDRELVKDPENPDSPFLGFQDLSVVGSATGNGQVFLAESNGLVCMVTKNMAYRSFKAYQVSALQMTYLRQHNLCVTIGTDEANGALLLKVWHFDKLDRQGLPFCSRISKINAPNECQVTALAVHSSLQVYAVGFSNSAVLFYRGDVTKEKYSNKSTLLRDGMISAPDGAVSGLAFSGTLRQAVLFVATLHSIQSYTVGNKDNFKDSKLQLDTNGCPPRCWAMCDQELSNQFVVARSDGIYLYQPDCRGQCYVFEGEKIMISANGSYVLVVSKDANTPQADESTTMNMVTIYDIPNIYIAYSAPVPEVVDVVYEWGCFSLITKTGKVYQLKEKDTQSKLDILYRKNLYDLAISLSKKLHYDDEGLANIYKQYGDYLYQKNDFGNSVKQYVKTIGKLEASYVIRKFLDAQRIKQLTEYLEELHAAKLANKDHTTILLNCYTKLSDTAKVEQFVKSSGQRVFFDVDTAIRVLRNAGYGNQAVFLAKSHGRHDMYLHIQLEDEQAYAPAIEYISQLPFEQAEEQLKRYGKILLEHCAGPTTELVKNLCSGFPNDKNELDVASADEFIHIFVNDQLKLREFLEHMIQTQPDCQPVMYNTLLELYLREYEKCPVSEKSAHSQKIMSFLKKPDMKYELDTGLILCQTCDFSPGMLYLYEKANLLNQVLQHHIDRFNFKEIITVCQKFGSQPAYREMWVQALWCFARADACPVQHISELLRNIEEQRVLPPLMVLEILSNSSTVTLSVVRDYLLRWLNTENEGIKSDEALIDDYKHQIQETELLISDLKLNGQVFQVSKCSACDHTLEVPTVHFLCKHSYHLHCFESYADAENESECPACLPENKKLRALISAQSQSTDQTHQFRTALQDTDDVIATLAEYFGKGIFHSETPPVVAPPMSTASKPAISALVASSAPMVSLMETKPPPQAVVKQTIPARRVEPKQASMPQKPPTLKGPPHKEIRTVPKTAWQSKVAQPKPTTGWKPQEKKKVVPNSTQNDTKVPQQSSLPKSTPNYSQKPTPESTNPFDEPEGLNPFGDDFDDDNSNNPFAGEEDD